MSDLNPSPTGHSSIELPHPLSEADITLDLRGTPCPINFVRTKLQLGKMAAGTLLEVWLDPGEPMEQVPDSLLMEGYGIEASQDCSGYFVLQIRKPA